jgi:hypothetical protein
VAAAPCEREQLLPGLLDDDKGNWKQNQWPDRDRHHSAVRGGPQVSPWSSSVGSLLTPCELDAAREFIVAVRRYVDAELVQASLFGSRSRGEARPDSDMDILLVFRRLPEDREPQASHAEAIAERVAARSGVPVTTWAVSLPDLARGVRTPMLVDALADSVPLWCAGQPLPRLPFTPDDGLWCADRLLLRVHEGGVQVAQQLDAGEWDEAARRIRDDVVRLCTALLLLRGTTRPRRGETVDAVARLNRWPAPAARILHWTSTSFGPTRQDEDLPVEPPPGGMPAAAWTIRLLTRAVHREMRRLEIRTDSGTSRPG